MNLKTKIHLTLINHARLMTARAKRAEALADELGNILLLLSNDHSTHIIPSDPELITAGLCLVCRNFIDGSGEASQVHYKSCNILRARAAVSKWQTRAGETR